ncbi:MAG: hypothetical protein ACRYG6_01340 [Janthinobacterium lividum]
MSKRPRPADLRQPDLFAAPGPQEPPPHAAPRLPRTPRNATPRPRRAASPPSDPPAPGPPAPEPPAPERPAVEPPAPPRAALPVPPAPEPPAHDPQPAAPPPSDPPPADAPRPAFRRVDPLAPRAADRPDSFLYCVLPRDAAEAVLRDGLPDENPPALVERGAVPRQLAATAEDLGWSDEQPGAIAVLRVRRTEIAPADARPRLRRLA